MRARASDNTPPMGVPAAVGAPDRDLAAWIIALQTQITNLLDAARTSCPTSYAQFARGLADVEDFAWQVNHQLRHLNMIWSHERQVNPRHALGNAWAWFASIGTCREVMSFLAIAARVDSIAIRRVSQLIAALLAPAEPSRACRGEG